MCIRDRSYGEAKTFFNQEAHIYYYLGRLLEEEGAAAEAKAAFEEAAVYKAAVSELSLFRALALQRLMRFTQAQQVLEEMLATADGMIQNKDLRSYYGVGSPSPMPFEYDIEKQNLVGGLIPVSYTHLDVYKRQTPYSAILWQPR